MSYMNLAMDAHMNALKFYSLCSTQLVPADLFLELCRFARAVYNHDRTKRKMKAEIRSWDILEFTQLHADQQLLILLTLCNAGSPTRHAFAR